MKYMIKLYKIIRLCAILLTASLVSWPMQAREVTLRIKSLDSGNPVSNAVIDLQSCHLGKFLTDEKGMIRLEIDTSLSCALYISSSGYITLVRSFQIPAGDSDLEMVFYMQKQSQYKMGRILNAVSFIPISNVTVLLRLEDETEQILGTTDKKGNFGLMNYHSGEYHLIFKHPDYNTQEKKIFVRRSDGKLGSFYLEGHKLQNRFVAEKSPKLTGITSKKFSFLGSDQKYIIVLGLYKGRENLPKDRDGLDIQFVEKGDWIRMFVGPYNNEKTALARLREIKEKYPQAMLKSE